MGANGHGELTGHGSQRSWEPTVMGSQRVMGDNGHGEPSRLTRNGIDSKGKLIKLPTSALVDNFKIRYFWVVANLALLALGGSYSISTLARILFIRTL